MFFAFSKILWALVQPLNLLCFLMALALLVRLRWKTVGERLLIAATTLLLILGLFPAGPLLLTWLERQSPAIETPTDLDGIIVLGGALNAYQTQKTGRISANEDIGRMFCALDAMAKNPQAQVILTGGSGDLLDQDAKEGDAARLFMALYNANSDKVIYEERSRNTYENAIFSKSVANPQTDEKWLLVTSAYHMPRSLSIFQKADWQVVAFPCAHRTDGEYRSAFKRMPSVSDNFSALNIVTKEMIGSMAYYITGKSASFWPPAQVRSSHAKHN